MVKTLPSKAGGAGSIPGQETKIPHGAGPKNQNIKQKRNRNKFSKKFKNDPHPKRENLKKKNSTPIFSKRTAPHLPPAPFQTSQPSSWSRRACSPGMLKARTGRCLGGTWEAAVAAAAQPKMTGQQPLIIRPVLSGPATSCRYHVNILNL